jgi:hypothetical protein
MGIAAGAPVLFRHPIERFAQDVPVPFAAASDDSNLVSFANVSHSCLRCGQLRTRSPPDTSCYS